MFIDCHIRVQSNLYHLQQVYAGFRELERTGRIRCRWEFVSDVDRRGHVEPTVRDSWKARVRVVVNSEARVIYDVHDSDHIDPVDLAWSDFYFKRSCTHGLAQQVGAPGKVLPLGLNTSMYLDSTDLESVRRSWRFDRGRTRLINILAGLKLDRVAPAAVPLISRPRNSFPAPRLAQEPRVLFMARTWDPEDSRDPAVQGDREEINEFRADCIRRLRSELGPDRFFGGFSHSPLAVARYGDCLLPTANQSSRRRYLRLLDDHPIAISTRGLHRSIGWKLAEYVCRGKAIVSEPIDSMLPGDFLEGRNYLEFDSPDECVEQVVRLTEDTTARREMMQRNAAYGSRYVMPDRMIYRTLSAALERPELADRSRLHG